jgi:hypothetical protein
MRNTERFMRFVLAVLLTAVWTFPYLAVAEEVPSRSKTSAPAPAARITLHRSSCPCGRCCVAETSNFRVQWCTSEENLRDLTDTCERMAAASKSTWLGEAQTRPWTPQCEIVVHREVNDYVAYLGPGSEQTSGCATIRLDQGRVVIRRIDLRADALDWKSESLPHELMHVVLADRFTTRRIPPWADEGIAMLSESPEKRGRRLTELRRVAGNGMTYAVRDLMRVQSSPEPALRNAFYGQSVALTSLLLEWGTRTQLLAFVEASLDQGPDAALSAVYGNRVVSELDQQLGQSIWTDRFVHLVTQSGTRTTFRSQAAAATK